MGGERTVRERPHWEQGYESPRAGRVRCNVAASVFDDDGGGGKRVDTWREL